MISSPFNLRQMLVWLLLCLPALWSCSSDPSPEPEPPTQDPFAAPVIVYPLDGATNVPLNPTLKWETSVHPRGGEVLYEIELEGPDISVGGEIRPGPRHWSTISSETIGSRTSLALTSRLVYFFPNTLYRWRITAIAANGDRETSDIFSFTTGEEAKEYGWTDGEVRVYQENTVGGEDTWTLIVTGDGFTESDLEEDGHWEVVSERAIKGLFSVEPFKTYRSHMRVLRIGAVSQDRGVSTKPNGTNGICTEIKNTRFGTMYDAIGSAWCGLYTAADYKAINFWPPTGHPGKTMDDADALIRSWVIPDYIASDAKMNNVAILVIMNVEQYKGTVNYYSSANTTMGFAAISPGPVGTQTGFENVIVHEIGGHGIGHLADEYISTPNTFPENRKEQTRAFQARGYYENVDVSGSKLTCPWKHFFTAPEYATSYSMVGHIEGARSYGKGIWRAEENSCMRQNELYFNPVQRESIVRKLKTAAGETHTWASFVEKDHQRLIPRAAITRAADEEDPNAIRQPEPRIVQIKR